jgi:hypothetical protein
MFAYRFSLVFLLTISFIALSYAEAKNTDDKRRAASADFKGLSGRWVRPDGGYILELKEVRKDGSLKAAYFNPRPIKVYRAEWKAQKDVISVTVELRDFNYPGSKYYLQFEPKTDRLKGTYFQAVYGEMYDVEFIREK